MVQAFVDSFNATFQTLTKSFKIDGMFTEVKPPTGVGCRKYEFNMKKYTDQLDVQQKATLDDTSPDKKKSRESALLLTAAFDAHKTQLKSFVSQIHASPQSKQTDDVSEVLVRTHLSKVYTSAYFFFSLHALSLSHADEMSKLHDTSSKSGKEATDKYAQLVKFVNDAMPLLFSSIDTK